MFKGKIISISCGLNLQSEEIIFMVENEVSLPSPKGLFHSGNAASVCEHHAHHSRSVRISGACRSYTVLKVFPTLKISSHPEHAHDD